MGTVLDYHRYLAHRAQHPRRDQKPRRAGHRVFDIDNRYDGSNFVARQVFFCGGDKEELNDWKRGLSKRAEAAAKKKVEQTLKLGIDEEAFGGIYGHLSRPFAVKAGQKIAIRVVSQFGEETTKVLAV